MREIRTSGLMSGDGNRDGAASPHPRPSSTLPIPVPAPLTSTGTSVGAARRKCVRHVVLSLYCASLSKIEALLFRRFPKPGDLFDVWHLLELGASLDQAQRGWLEDRLATQEMEFADVRHRLKSLPAQKLATSLLRHLKPEQRAFWNERKAAVAVRRVTKFLREELE